MMSKLSPSQGNYSEKYSFLYNAINDTQETIRFTDSKSGAVIIVVMGLIAGLVTLIDKYYIVLKELPSLPKDIAIFGIIYFLSCLFISLILALRSINPANNPNHHIEIGDWSDRPNIKYYLSGLTPLMRWKDYLWELKDSKFGLSASEYHRDVEGSEDDDLLRALTFEFLKLSYIKEKKMQRTKVSLKCLEQCVLAVAITSIMVVVTYHIQALSAWNIRELNYNIFICLFIGHVLGDYLLQTSWQAENKNGNWDALIIHSIIYSVVIYTIALISGGVSLITVSAIFLTHILLDKGDFVNWWIRNIKKEQTDNKQIYFLVDQSLHMFVLLIVAMNN